MTTIDLTDDEREAFREIIATKPMDSEVQAMRRLVYHGSFSYSSTALLALAQGTEDEFNAGDEYAAAAAAILREAAEKMARLEAKTI